MSQVDYLLSTRAIRDRAETIYELARAGKTSFSVHPERLNEVADFVTEVTLANYPDLKIPFHSRWGHFQVGKINRLKDLEAKLAHLDLNERVRAKLDLAVVSVLLDAGSGPGWSYLEKTTGQKFARSEGLAVASFHMFLAGAFSSDPSRPLQADVRGLAQFTAEKLAEGFQVSSSNPLAGLEGRAKLIRSLSQALEMSPHYFGRAGRPGHILDHCFDQALCRKVPAVKLLNVVLRGFAPIWPGRVTLDGQNLGDVWHYAPLGAENDTKALVPFHKLSQWLTYSLIEPIEEAGLPILDLDEMTGLAEYRNGGLILDKKLVELRDPSMATRSHLPSSPLIVEWRALTVAFLDRLGEQVRKNLGKTKEEFPLARVLEGGTWWAGRKIAASLRTDGGPPLKLESDGTVF